MRKQYETRNFSGLLGHIEEIQTLANRMEAALGDARDIKDLRERRSELKDEVRKLKEEIKKLEKQAGKKPKKKKYKAFSIED